MRAGYLRHRLTLQQPVRAQNEILETITTWSDVATVWGSIEPLRGTSYFAAKQANSEVDGKITIRYREVQPTWRIKWTDSNDTEHIFEIVSIINPHEKGNETQILYSEDLD